MKFIVIDEIIINVNRINHCQITESFINIDFDTAHLSIWKTDKEKKVSSLCANQYDLEPEKFEKLKEILFHIALLNEK